MSKPFLKALMSTLFLGLLAKTSVAQAPKPTSAGDASTSAQRAVKLAKSGHCSEAIPLLKAAKLHVTDKELKSQVGFAGVRCAMGEDRQDSAVEFLRFLNREFPHDPDVLYLSVHTYSDLSTQAAQELATTAPASYQAHELNAESLELQGKWDLAAKEYRLVLQQNPRLPGIHFRLGRLLLSKPDPRPSVAEEAQREFQQELEIDPNNAGAEYVLGELARQAQQWDQAIQHFSRAAQLDAGFGDAYLGLGTSLLSVKKFAEAIPSLETAVKLEPRNPVAHYSLAMAYTRVGRKPDADKEFAIHRQMTEKGPGGQQPQENQADPN
jgi:tetratricopeptide (TPR) repeat protein